MEASDKLHLRFLHIRSFIKKQLNEYNPPGYDNSMDYVRTGAYIVVVPDENYDKLFPQDSKNIFIHHLHAPYIYLARKLSLPNGEPR